MSFAFISRFHFHYSHHSTDGKWCLFAIQKITKAIFATPTKQFLLADEEFSKNPHNSAAWNNRTWVLRLSHAFIFIIHLIQQTGSDVCFRFQRLQKLSSRHQRNNFCQPMSFFQKTHITQQHGIMEREFCVYLRFSFSLFTSFNRQEVMLVCDSKDNKS